MIDLRTIRARLAQVGQDHVLRFYDSLTPAGQQNLLTQIASLDLESLPGLVETYVRNKPRAEVPTDLRPATYYPNNPDAASRPWDRSAAYRRGEDLIRRGKVGAFVVAGGQGSRLGFDGPKGCFPAGAVTGKPLFQVFAENLLGAKDRYSVRVPWYIMTSPLNHDPTVAFFRDHDYFGLSREDTMFFPQGVMPSFDIATGKVPLASKGEVATNPDGHGGCIRALHVSGSLADMQRRGIEHLSYFQVDNPVVRVLDPVFLGLHAGAPDSSAEMSSKMVPKAGPDEKVGVFCLAGGKLEVLEYSDLPPDLAKARNPDGSLTYNAGSIAIHIMGVEFLQRLATDPRFALPFHRAEKKVPCIDPESGEPITPAGNNGVKLEKFVFDALALARASIVYETDRVEEFAPIKNATGVDSVQTSKQLQTLRAARWLESRGVSVPRTPGGDPDCTLEVSPRTATSAAELPVAGLPKAVERGARLAL
ncbi:UDP-N-acetylglucosamine/UDP-N-acetylgalactosaminediphosphorylase [Phycisphaerales bacterium]|nr:UDP-N-acetylglucosamine/UDP-N-acetylgalactosaminediphosphorylase [Phycisphaerales bacterium]